MPIIVNNLKKICFSVTSVMLLSLFVGCSGLPDDIQPVANFNVNTYQGTWYEIARLDHSFERGLDQVTANYSLRDDGGVTVINRGFNQEEQKWQEAEGRAYSVGEANVGHLKVSFFRPFYASYVVFELGSKTTSAENADYAFVSSYSKDYVWLLSRTPTISPELKAHFLQQMNTLGFSSEKLIWVNQKTVKL